MDIPALWSNNSKSAILTIYRAHFIKNRTAARDEKVNITTRKRQIQDSQFFDLAQVTWALLMLDKEAALH